MKSNQIIFSLLLIWVIFANQISAFNNFVTTDETNDLIQSISAGIVKINDLSQQQIISINAKKKELETILAEIEILSTNLQNLKEQKRVLAEQIVADKSETIGKENAAIEQGMKAAKEKAENAYKTLTDIGFLEKKIIKVIDELAALYQQSKSAETARLALTTILQDRNKAAKLLEAIRNKNSSEATSLIVSAVADAGNTTSAAVASLTADESGAKITFRIGNLTHCISTKIQCGGQSATVSK